MKVTLVDGTDDCFAIRNFMVQMVPVESFYAHACMTCVGYSHLRLCELLCSFCKNGYVFKVVKTEKMDGN